LDPLAVMVDGVWMVWIWIKSTVCKVGMRSVAKMRQRVMAGSP